MSLSSRAAWAAALSASLIVLGDPRLLAGKGHDAAGGSGVTVEGDLTLPPLGVEEPPSQFEGFVPRTKNPITELRPFDPRPECFVYLDGPNAPPDSAKPPDRAVVWELVGESFGAPVMPVVLGSNVDIKNTGRNTFVLFSPDQPELVPHDAIGPGGVRTVVPKVVNVVARVQSQDSPHLEGRLVAMSTHFFSRIGRDGSFHIDDVPPGRWTLRVWYRDGWLPALQQVIDVGGSKPPKVKVTLPERLEPKNAAGDKDKAPK